MHTITSSLGRLTSGLVFSACCLGITATSSLASPHHLIASIHPAEFDSLVSPEATTADDYYNRGLFLQGEGNLDGALEQFDQAIALNDTSADLFFSRGLTYTDKGDHKAAQADFSQAIALDPSFSAAYYQRGMSRIALPIGGVVDPAQPSMSLVERDRIQSAIVDFSSALEYSPDFVAAHYYRGLSHYVMGNELLATQDYQKAQSLNPLIADSFYRQGFPRLYIGGPEVEEE